MLPFVQLFEGRSSFASGREKVGQQKIEHDLKGGGTMDLFSSIKC
jgi:hypothetical protein